MESPEDRGLYTAEIDALVVLWNVSKYLSGLPIPGFDLGIGFELTRDPINRRSSRFMFTSCIVFGLTAN
jgi:hypothetical protein